MKTSTDTLRGWLCEGCKEPQVAATAYPLLLCAACQALYARIKHLLETPELRARSHRLAERLDARLAKEHHG